MASLRSSARAQSVVRTASYAVGRATASLRMRPDFLIVGAQRCGTTSMYKTLSQHPGVLPAVNRKGIHYFDTDYQRGPLWYQAHFPLEATARKQQHRLGLRPITGESSPYYMFHPLAAQRIARDLPDVRLVVMLRDPVERSYSAHAHETARGYETESFERALELEPERLEGQAALLAADPTYASHQHQHNAYLTRGQYCEQLQHLAQAVGRDRMYVVDSQHFFETPERSYDDLLRFLGLPAWPATTFEQHNARPRSPMSIALRERLLTHFEPYDEQLTQWLGHPPSWRL